MTSINVTPRPPHSRALRDNRASWVTFFGTRSRPRRVLNRTVVEASTRSSWLRPHPLLVVALNVEDLEESELCFKVIIRHSQTDQEGAGQTIAIMRGSEACPVAALRAWLEAAGITAGPIFRSVKTGGAVAGRLYLPPQSVADIVKAYAERVGLDPALFAGHSMRSGFLTSAAKRGTSIFKMMDRSRHRSVETLRGYVRDAEIFKRHAGASLL